MADDVIRKAALAKILGLSRARISQLCKAGLPVRADGKLDRAEALRWIKGEYGGAVGRYGQRAAFPISISRDEAEAAGWLSSQPV